MVSPWCSHRALRAELPTTGPVPSLGGRRAGPESGPGHFPFDDSPAALAPQKSQVNSVGSERPADVSSYEQVERRGRCCSMENRIPQLASVGGSGGLLPPRRRTGLPIEESERRGDAELLDRVRIQHQRQLSADGAATEPPASTPLSGASEGCATGKGPLPCLEYQVLASRLVGSAVPFLKKLLRTGSIKKQLLTRRLPNNLTSDDYERLHTSKAARDELALTSSWPTVRSTSGSP